MHLIRIDTVSLDEGEAAVDLGQEPGDLVILSFTDSDLFGVAAAHAAEPGLPSLRLAKLARLRHPMSVDLYVDRVIARARAVVVRCLGGLDYWRYGIERAAAAARANGVHLAVLPGDDRPDPRLAAFSTDPALATEIDAYFRAGGPANLRRMLGRLAHAIGHPATVEPPEPLPRGFPWCPGCGPLDLATARAAADWADFPISTTAPVIPGPRSGARDPEPPTRPDPDASACLDPGLSPGASPGMTGVGVAARETARTVRASAPLALLLVYRSAVLGGDTAPVAALVAALGGRGIASLVLAVSSLKDPEAVEAVREAIAARRPDLVVTTTAFSAREDAGFVLDGADCPVLQAHTVGAPRAAWAASARGLGGADLAMQVALPEFDGRLAGFPIAFKEEAPEVAGFAERRAAPYPEGIAALADRAAGWLRLARLPRAERRLAVVLSDYPARGGRAGFAVGLDTEASARALLADLAGAGYAVQPPPEALMEALMGDGAAFAVPLAVYAAWLADLPEAARAALHDHWGPPEADPLCRDGAFRFPRVRAGRGAVFLQPDRGRGDDRKAGYHDPDAAPTHAYLAFYLGLRQGFDALVHLGTHGTTEWLPGKAVALSPDCWPARAVGALPVVYPFIVDDPGEAAPLKRRLGGVALGHLTPRVETGGLDAAGARLRELVEEYSAASVLDPRRAALIARAILEDAEGQGLLAAAGIDADTPMADALTALDAHLCDLGETAFRDGLHVFGRAPEGAPPEIAASARAERAGLLAALDGRFVAPGPAGSPNRGRRDVLPTGRNLTTLDPRALPTRAAAELGARAAEAVVTRYLQDEGEYPARVVMDLWASPTLRTGGEDVAQALALMGVRPTWDHATTRVTGFEVLPPALLGRPRIDVTVRISGAFRDTFPETLSLLDRAARAVAAREETDEDNPLAAARRRGEAVTRVYGAAPGRYGAAAAETALDGAWGERADLGRAYLAATSHAYGDAEGQDAAFADLAARADAYVHAFDVAERDLFDGDAATEAMGGFAAAAELGGGSPALYGLDTARTEPKVRTAREEAARLIGGRLANPRWVAAQLRHGYRGVQDLAQGIDAVFVLAATTDAVGDAGFDRLWTAWIADIETFERLRAANPAATRAILDRFEEARARGLWRTRRNAPSPAVLMREAAE
ncbi:cobaltochelatase subunit CobN [Methylobacterium sp. A54F]